MSPLSEINLLTALDWTQDESTLTAELQAIIEVISSHHHRYPITLWIDSTHHRSEEIHLLLSGVVLNLLMREDLDVSPHVEIALLESILLSENPAITDKIQLCLQGSGSDYHPLFFNHPTLTVADLETIPTEEIFLVAGDRLFRQGNWQGASEQYQQYLKNNIGSETLYWNLAECYRCLEQLDALTATIEQGINYYPEAGHLYFLLITDLRRRGKVEQALPWVEKATEKLPCDYTFQLLKHLIVPALYHTTEEIEFYRERFSKGLDNLMKQTQLNSPEDRNIALRGICSLTNFYLSFQGKNDRDLQIKYGQLVQKIVNANFPQWSYPLTMPTLAAGEKIRVGYASAYLHSYSGTLWLIGWLKQQDRSRFEVYCYYTSNTPDEVTEQFKQYSDYFYQIPKDLETVCQQIRQDNLHILVFPELGMDAPTFAMAGLRLAPVQCTAWGHPVTTGLPTVDYFLSSELMEGEGAEEHYSEQLVRLPNIGVAYPKPTIPPLIKKRSDYQLADERTLYLCCQSPVKYLPQYDYMLPAIAAQVPHAQFLFLRGTLLKPRLKVAFAEMGLDYREYCVFRRIPERLDYLMINLLSDVYLDTLSWSGGNTSLEAIACHLPVVTCPGEFMRGRHTDSFLKMIGVGETIAQDEAEYIEIAVKLGRNERWREEVRAKMGKCCDRLYEDPQCVQGLETFYQQVVHPS
ncbi:glycosyl transferase family 1 [Spirulina subsalsa FACHB-351]|uniref:Glycosyl transferase family 1 n=1 Tax=Spirulina subsalsa FACHB-351 TaxID=234711 RepID=A0ABT3L5D2_9CYAN|nr:glycosyltransferase family 41 protein [Spirulina subsalsa]MCW6036662.1 glycosyl transferase family 1 [Spirulina subsalsa FACHB-351]